VLVAREAGQVVGFAGISPARDPDLDPASVGQLTTIYLLPQAWGRGHGRDLMTGALAALDQAGYREAVLYVLDTNTRARNFYQAGGWQPDGTAKQEPLRGTAVTLNEVRYRHRLPAA
jgi:ribosomal protein S18 acetylase RimI-like enzyme